MSRKLIFVYRSVGCPHQRGGRREEPPLEERQGPFLSMAKMQPNERSIFENNVIFSSLLFYEYTNSNSIGFSSFSRLTGVTISRYGYTIYITQKIGRHFMPLPTCMSHGGPTFSASPHRLTVNMSPYFMVVRPHIFSRSPAYHCPRG